MFSKRRRIDGATDGVNAVKGTGEDEVVVAVEFLEAGCEGAVVDQTSGFVDDQEREDDPGRSSTNDMIRCHAVLTCPTSRCRISGTA